jgi:histidyl-tRNA synthetase
MTDAERPAAIALATRLRSENQRVDLSLLAQKPKHFFGKAGNSSARFAIFLGPDDVATGVAQVKDLQTRDAQQMKL